jgi:hypothetical protein
MCNKIKLRVEDLFISSLESNESYIPLMHLILYLLWTCLVVPPHEEGNVQHDRTIKLHTPEARHELSVWTLVHLLWHVKSKV